MAHSSWDTLYNVASSGVTMTTSKDHEQGACFAKGIRLDGWHSLTNPVFGFLNTVFTEIWHKNVTSASKQRPLVSKNCLYVAY
jgi:hypothetical protein